jgi:hypothetical protein
MRSILIAAALLMLAACDTTPAIPPSPDLGFNGAPFALNVANVQVIDDYLSPRRAPNVEYLSDFPPTLAVHRWATARLVAAGHKGRLEVDIKNASIVRTYLPKANTGLSALVTKEQTERYDGTLTVTLKIYDDTHILPVAHVDATVEQSSTIREDASLSDREQLYRDISVRLINALDAQMNRNIRQYFSHYLL